MSLQKKVDRYLIHPDKKTGRYVTIITMFLIIGVVYVSFYFSTTGLGTYNELKCDPLEWSNVWDRNTETGVDCTQATSFKTTTHPVVYNVTNDYYVDSVSITLLVSGNEVIDGDAQQKLYTHGNLYTGNTFAVDGVEHVLNKYTWYTNPYTSEPWTWDEINSLETGFAMKLDSLPLLSLDRCIPQSIRVLEMWVNGTCVQGSVYEFEQ